MLASRWLAVVVVLLLAPNARAQPRIRHPVQLEYIRGERTQDCPGKGMLRHAILSRMNEDPFVPAAASKARVAILRVGPAFQASYELLNDEEEYVKGQPLPRRGDCINAVEDAALAVSIDMPLLVSDSTPQPIAVTQQAPATSPPKKETPTKNEKEKPPPKLPPVITGWADVGVVVTSGAAPRTSGGFTLHGGAGISAFSFLIGLRYEAPAGVSAGPVRISAERKLFEMLPCLHWRFLFGCGLAQIGELTGRFENPSYSKTDGALSVSIGGRIGFVLPSFHGFAAYAAGDLAGTVRSADLIFRHKIWWLAPRTIEGVGGGVVVRFGDE